MSRENYLAQLRALSDRRVSGAEIEAEGPLRIDPEKTIAQAEEEGRPTVGPAGLPGNWLTRRVRFVKEAALQDWSGEAARAEREARELHFGGRLEKPFQELGRLDDEYRPTPEEIVSAAEEFGLDARYYERLANARSAEDMRVLARLHARRQQREVQLAHTLPGAEQFLLRGAVAMVDPVFLAAGGSVSGIARVGAGATRTANAMRTAGAGAATDAPLEALRAQQDPAVTAQQAAANVVASTLIGGALGGLFAGVSRQELDHVDGVSERIVDGSYFQGSSVGAAQSAAVPREPRSIEELVGDAPDKVGFNVYGTPLNFLERSDDDLTRSLSAKLSWNPNTRGAQQETAYEVARRIDDSGLQFTAQAREAAAGYWKDRGRTEGWWGTRRHQTFGGVSDDQLNEFMSLVGQVHAGVRQSDNPHVLRAVKAYRDGYEDSLRYVQDSHYNGRAVDTGSPGHAMEQFADVEFDPSYVMRRFDRAGFLKVQNALGGNEGIASRLSAAILRSNREWLGELAERWNARPKSPDATGNTRPDMSPEFMALRIARKYVDTVEGVLSHVQREGPSLRGVSREDREAVREIVRQEFRDGTDFAGDTEDAIEMVLDLIAPAKSKNAESPRARPRMRLDLDAERDGPILDMFDWQAENLFTSYRRHMAGYGALNRTGFTSLADLNRQIDEIEKRSRGQSEKRQRRAAKEIEYLRALRDMTMGNPLNKDSGTWGWLTQQARRSNVANLMNNVGFVAMSEVMGAFLTVGPLRFLKRLPEYRRYMKAVKAGDADTIREVMALSDQVMGHGSHQLRMRLSGTMSRFDANDSDILIGVPRGAEKVDALFRKSANLTSRASGMAAIAQSTRMIVATSTAEDWVAAARKGGMPYGERRMASLGVTEDMWGRMAVQIRRTTGDLESPDTGRSLPAYRLDEWDDPEALNVFINALDRNARRLVLEGDAGHRPLALDKYNTLRVLFQFLSFPLNAFSKHLGYALNVSDYRAAMEVAFMSLGGALGVWARTGAQALAITDEDERQAFLEERLTPQEFAKAMVYYSAHASIMPNLADLPLGALEAAGVPGAAPMFSYTRSTGLPADPVTGNPTYDRASRAIPTFAALFQDTKFSEEDLERNFRLYAPLGNHVVALAVFNQLAEIAPEEEDAEDAD